MRRAIMVLGKKRILLIGGQKVEARLLVGSNDIYVSSRGEIIMPFWWPEEKKGETPGQRERAGWKAAERHWRVYSGLNTALRGMKVALFKGRLREIPFFEKILAIAREDLREKIIGRESFRDLPKKTKQELFEAGLVLEKAKKPELQEVWIKMLFLYRDLADGRLNVGALLARSTAISDRLMERLRGLYSWGNKYSLREKFLELAEEQARVLIQSFDRRIKFMVRHEAFIKNATTPAQRKLIIDKLAFSSREMGSLLGVEPFSRWAEFVIADLDEAAERIKEKKYDSAKNLLNKIAFSLKLKKGQEAIDRLIMIIDEDQIRGKINRDLYFQEIHKLLELFIGAEDQEERLGFKEKIGVRASSLLMLAFAQLKDGLIKELKKTLKEVEDLL